MSAVTTPVSSPTITKLNEELKANEVQRRKFLVQLAEEHFRVAGSKGKLGKVLENGRNVLDTDYSLCETLVFVMVDDAGEPNGICVEDCGTASSWCAFR